MFNKEILPGVELKLFEERHALALYSAVSADRDHLRQWLPWVDATRSSDDALEFIRKSLRQFSKNSGFHAGIWIDGECGGAVGCQAINWLNRKVEFGYWLARGAQGRGIMTAKRHDEAGRDLEIRRKPDLGDRHDDAVELRLAQLSASQDLGHRMPHQPADAQLPLARRADLLSVGGRSRHEYRAAARQSDRLISSTR